MFADVALPKRRYQVFTYLVPPKLRGRLHIGSRVLVPLGRTTTQGLVFQLAERIPGQLGARGISGSNLREICGLIDSSEDANPGFHHDRAGPPGGRLLPRSPGGRSSINHSAGFAGSNFETGVADRFRQASSGQSEAFAPTGLPC